MQETNPELNPDCFYHVYNRANGNEKIFTREDNYRYFLDKYKQHIGPVANTFCYCLMPNHFHFLIQVKNENQIKENFIDTHMKFETLEKLVSKQFSNFFSAYTQAYNKQNNRMGSLFMKVFKRKRISDQRYLLKLVHYIHLNPIESGFCNAPEKWVNSSYNSIISQDTSFLKSKEVIEWFENKTNFIYIHKVSPEETGINKFE